MKTFTLSIAIFLLSHNSFSQSTDKPKLWNNVGKELAFSKGDEIKIKVGSNSSKYVKIGKVEYVCNAKYIKVNGYFIAISDVEVITKYWTVKS